MCSDMSLIYKLKSKGLRGSPCLRPLEHLKNLVLLFSNLTAHSVFRYMFFRSDRNLPFIFLFSNCVYNNSWGTESNAFFKIYKACV